MAALRTLGGGGGGCGMRGIYVSKRLELYPPLITSHHTGHDLYLRREERRSEKLEQRREGGGKKRKEKKEENTTKQEQEEAGACVTPVKPPAYFICADSSF